MKIGGPLGSRENRKILGVSNVGVAKRLSSAPSNFCEIQPPAPLWPSLMKFCTLMKQSLMYKKVYYWHSEK